MISKIAAIAGALMVLGSPIAASAMPAYVVGRATGAPVVTLVSGGCGIGFHRGPYGGCRPNVGWVAPGPRVVVRPAWGWHRPAYGWRHYRRW
ncbi:MAG: hypothetical protein JWM36_2850 [Hyphomicrobiales bacterium]|nr:hypothetical protein [Hyphomicrobiales bacterium]